MVSRNKLNHFFFTIFGFRPVKSRAELFAVIIFHVLAWLLFLWIPLLFYPSRFIGDTIWHRELAIKILPIGFFYLNYYFLLPRFFEKRKLGVYFFLVLSVVVSMAASDIVIRKKLGNNFFRSAMAVRAGRPVMLTQQAQDLTISLDSSVPLMYAPSVRPAFSPAVLGETQAVGVAGEPGVFSPVMVLDHTFIFGLPKPALLMSLSSTLSNCFFMLIISGMLRLAYSFLKSENKKKSLENATLNAEVDLLKAQINPHFLFNTLNSIYSLANVKSDKTDEAILKLSGLLRYALYETTEGKVLLQSDIEYINNYIDLQRLRLSNKVTVDYQVTGNADNKLIAPMLLITFIENAFKHGVSYVKRCLIKINIEIFDETLTLQITNPIVEKNSFVAGGIGLKNVQRRLELLYPDQHQLQITQDLHQFSVSLKISI
jgi:two-component system LytT family sensor kinase